jgi:uncharacterized cupin superfamily protein
MNRRFWKPSVRLQEMIAGAQAGHDEISLSGNSEPGALKAGNYPLDEFVYVLEGDVVTLDADGTRHEFHPGDALVIPKGWVGLWDMKTSRRSSSIFKA